MPENIKYVVDQDVEEYFTFSLFGHGYKFRYPNTDEMKQIAKATQEKDQKKLAKYLLAFVTKIDSKSPSLQSLEKRMTPPIVRNFNKMIRTELSLTE